MHELEEIGIHMHKLEEIGIRNLQTIFFQMHKLESV